MRMITLLGIATCSVILATWKLLSTVHHPARVIIPASVTMEFTSTTVTQEPLGDLESPLLRRFIDKYAVRPGDQQTTSTEQTTTKKLMTTKLTTEALTTPLLAPCPEAPIVTVQTGGRMGNRLWEYAAVWSLARFLGRPGYAPEGILVYLGHVFSNLSLPSLESISHCNLSLGEPLKRYQLTPISMLPKKFKGKNLLLHKWIIHPEPIILFREQLRKEFHFLPYIKKQVKETFSKLKHGVTYIGIHVRRSDFSIYLPKEFNVNLVAAKYFKDAMAWYRKKLTGPLLFLVVSDDAEWCQKELVEGANDVVVVSKSPGHDMAILTSCNHTIIDYGSFGAWGALMAGGYTISVGVDKLFDNVMKTLPEWNVWSADTLHQ